MVCTHNQNPCNCKIGIPRRFKDKWATHPTCEDTIRDSWAGRVVEGSPTFQLFKTIKHCRQTLVSWSRGTFGATKTKIQEKQKLLLELTNQNKAELSDEIQRVKAEINAMLYHEEVAWRQRSWSIWLPAGDKNTKYFHQRASQHHQKNHIASVFNGDGVWCDNEDEIAQIAEHYIQNLFTSAQPNNMSDVLDSVDRLVTPDMNRQLLLAYTPEKVKRVLFQMHPSKSPGLMVCQFSSSKSIGILLETMLKGLFFQH